MVMEHKICNVRGGDFCKIELTDEELEIIEEWVKKAEQLCYKCKGLYGSHLAKRLSSNYLLWKKTRW